MLQGPPQLGLVSGTSAGSFPDEDDELMVRCEDRQVVLRKFGGRGKVHAVPTIPFSPRQKICVIRDVVKLHVSSEKNNRRWNKAGTTLVLLVTSGTS